MKKMELSENYGEIIPWEIPIQIITADCVNEDDLIFDIGANIGALAIAFSRMVPKGWVYTFEPNRDIWHDLEKNLSLNETSNVTFLGVAFYDNAAKLVNFHSDPSVYKAASSIVNTPSNAYSQRILTHSLDDFTFNNAIFPDFIKLDCEGAEASILKAGKKLLRHVKPTIITEYCAHETITRHDLLTYLQKHGYYFFDVNEYEQVSAEYYSTNSPAISRNVLCIHKSNPISRKYLNLEKVLQSTWPSTEHRSVLPEFIVDEGRYIVAVDLSCQPDTKIEMELWVDGKRHSFQSSDGKHMENPVCSNFVIELNRTAKVSVHILSCSMSSSSINKVSLFKINLGTEKNDIHTWGKWFRWQCFRSLLSKKKS